MIDLAKLRAENEAALRRLDELARQRLARPPIELKRHVIIPIVKRGERRWHGFGG